MTIAYMKHFGWLRSDCLVLFTTEQLKRQNYVNNLISNQFLVY